MSNFGLEKNNKAETWLFLFKRFFKIIFWLLVLVVLLRLFLFQPFFVKGPSMEETFYQKDLVFAEKVSYHFSPPQRYQVILFHPPINPKEVFIKRIIGLPKEKVQIKEGSVFIFNNEFPEGLKLEEPYRQGKPFSEQFEIELNEDEYFLVGDNTPQSFDSRDWGPLRQSLIIGKVFIRIFPLNNIKTF